LGALPLAVPFALKDVIGIAFLKMIAILATVGGGWPGGIIFPLFYVGGYVGQAASLIIPGLNQSLAIVCCMAGVEVAVTRTPWATNVILQLLHRSFLNSDAKAVSIFPVLTMACYCSLFLTEKYSFFPKKAQHSRKDITLHKLQTDLEVDLPEIGDQDSDQEEEISANKQHEVAL